MAQVKIEITFDPSKETLAQAISALTPQANIDVNSLGEAVTQEALSRIDKANKTKAEKPTTDPAPVPADKAEAATKNTASVEDQDDADRAAAGDPEEKPVSKTDVRAVATALSKAGKRDELKAAFAKFGGSKLSDIKESDYPALMRELVSING